MRVIDRVLGNVLIVGCRVAQLLIRTLVKRSFPELVKKIAIVKLVGLGDTVLLVTMAKLLKDRYPDAEVIAVCTPQSSVLCKEVRQFDRVIEFDVVGEGNLIRKFLGLVRTLRIERIDLLLDCEQHFRFLPVASFLSAPRWSVGFYHSRIRGLLYDSRVFLEPKQHMLMSYVDLLRPLGIKELPARLEKPSFRAPSSTAIREQCRKFAADGRKIVGIHCGAGARGRIKEWPLEYFSELINMYQNQPYVFCFTGSLSDQANIRAVLSRVADQSRCRDFSGRLAIQDTAYLMERMAVYLTIDTGTMHLAAAMHAPVVALFGPETPVRYAPYGPGNRSLYLGLRCSPCILNFRGVVSPCSNPIFMQCLKDMTPANVKRELDLVLRDQRAQYSLGGD